MPLLDGLESYWKLDETSGIRRDSHRLNHLTEDSGVTGFAAGKQGNAADLEKNSTARLTIVSKSSLSPGDSDFTFAAWVQLEDLQGTENSMLGKSTIAGGQREYQLQHSDVVERFQFLVSTLGTTGSLVSVTANNFGIPPVATWHFVVAWHDSVLDTLNIQINDGTPDSAPHAAGVFVGTSNFSIGSMGQNSNHWDGLIDEVGFWRRVLTAEERTALYNAGAGVTYPFGETIVSGRGSRNFGLAIPFPY